MNSKIKEHKKGAIINGFIGGLGIISTIALSLVSVKIDKEIEDSDTKSAFRLIAGTVIVAQGLNTAHAISDMSYHKKSLDIYKGVNDSFIESKKEAK